MGLEHLLEDAVEAVCVGPDLPAEIAVGMEFLRELEVGALDDFRVGPGRNAQQLVVGTRERELEFEDPPLHVAVDVERRVEEVHVDPARNALDLRCAGGVHRLARRNDPLLLRGR